MPDDLPKLLRTSGPLGKKHAQYSPTNEDLLENAYEQNRAINVLTLDMHDVKKTVANHGSVLALLEEILKAIRKFWKALLWILAFLGVGGVWQLLRWATGH